MTYSICLQTICQNILNEENKQLEGRVFEVPPELLKKLHHLYDMVKDNEYYTDIDGYKRLCNVIEGNGKISYDMMRRILNFFTTYSGKQNDPIYTLNGGDEMFMWVKQQLHSQEEFVQMSKTTQLSTRYKDTPKITVNPQAVEFGGQGTNKKEQPVVTTNYK